MSSAVSSATAASSASSTTTSKSKTLEGRDEFLKLLTYQLKAQNPLSPTSNQDFTAQLAQFSQLDILTDMRTLMEKQSTENQTLSQTISNTALPGLIGKSAKVSSSKFAFDGESNAKLGYNLGAAAKAGEIVIKDSAGVTVRTIKLSGTDLSSGNHEFSWDGKDADGNKLPAGKFTFAANITKSDGTAGKADCFTFGTIQSVRFTSDGTKLVIGGEEMQLSDVTDISTNS